MENDLISKKEVLEYLKTEYDKLVEGYNNKSDVIPFEARQGALLSIKAMVNFIKQAKVYENNS